MVQVLEGEGIADEDAPAGGADMFDAFAGPEVVEGDFDAIGEGLPAEGVEVGVEGDFVEADGVFAVELAVHHHG